MKIIPQEIYQLYSSLPVAELEGKLSDFFEKESYNIFWNKDTKYPKTLPKTFHASTYPTISILSYVPKIEGELKRIAEDTTEIVIIARMNKNAKVFYIIWLCIMLLFLVPSLLIVVMEFIHRESQIWTMIPTLLFVIGYCGVSLTFYRKSKSLKNKLTRLFD